MITCTDFMAEIGNYLEGEVAAEVRLQLENHLAHCETCHVVLDTARKTVKVVTESGSFALPDAAAKTIAASIMARIRSQGGP